MKILSATEKIMFPNPSYLLSGRGYDIVTPESCPFCDITETVLENKVGVVKPDAFPVSPGHLLIIPREHIKTYFELLGDTRQGLWDLVQDAREFILASYQPDGFNIGVNVGDAGGQTIFHVHIHLIPRYRGDVSNPRGGVRGVIPSMQEYKGN